MKKFLLPLGIFVVGMFLLLFSTLFYPAIGTAATTLQAETADIASHYWGWSWAVGSTRFLLFASGLIAIVISVGVAWLQRR